MSVTRSQPTAHEVLIDVRQTLLMPALTLAVLTMTTAQLFDLGTFVTMVARVGPAAEANPLVAGVLEAYGLPMAVIVKMALIALVVAVSVVLTARSHRLDRRLGVAVISVAIVAGLFGGWTNAATIGHVPIGHLPL
jgi:hypothetical protein